MPAAVVWEPRAEAAALLLLCFAIGFLAGWVFCRLSHPDHRFGEHGL